MEIIDDRFIDNKDMEIIDDRSIDNIGISVSDLNLLQWVLMRNGNIDGCLNGQTNIETQSSVHVTSW